MVRDRFRGRREKKICIFSILCLGECESRVDLGNLESNRNLVNLIGLLALGLLLLLLVGPETSAL